jgi:hypothetical protein
LPADELMPLAETLLEVPQGLIGTVLDLELKEGTVVADRVGETPCVFLAGLHRAKRTIAERLATSRRHAALALDCSRQGIAAGRGAHRTCAR